MKHLFLVHALQKMESFMFPLGLGSSSSKCSSYWWPCWEDHHPSDLSGESSLLQRRVWHQYGGIDVKCLCDGMSRAQIPQRQSAPCLWLLSFWGEVQEGMSWVVSIAPLFLL